MKTILSSFDRAFAGIDRLSRELLAKAGDDMLFAKVETVFSALSCGEYLLRSAGAVEQCFGGITARLWDDPFEWTLPEALGTKAAVLNYFDEVEATRVKGFRFFASDEDLSREIPAPETLLPISAIFLKTLAKASHLQGRAYAVYATTTGEKPPPI